MSIHAEIDGDGVVVKRLRFKDGREPPGFLDGSECNIGDVWDGQSFTPPAPVAIPIEERRDGMHCSPLQGRLALGEATCEILDAMAIDLQTPWAMRQTITQAIEWRRTSQAMDELGYLLGYTPEQMDDLFEFARTITV